MAPTTAPTRAESQPDLGIAFRPSYCTECLAAGCSYAEAVTPDSGLRWSGGKTVTTEHECDRCGHRWTDRWPVHPWLLGPEERP